MSATQRTPAGGRSGIGRLVRGSRSLAPHRWLRDLWAIEMGFDYDSDRFDVIVIHQWCDGLVVRETSYYASPFQAPAWRARWVEPAASAASS